MHFSDETTVEKTSLPRWGLLFALFAAAVSPARAAQFYFTFVVPNNATVGPPNNFSVTIQVRDAANGGQIVDPTEIPAGPPVIQVTAASGNGTLNTTSVPLTGPTVTFNEAYTAAGNLSLIANAFFSGQGVSGQSSFIAMSAGPYVKVVAVFPGENLSPGSIGGNGKTGAPSDQFLVVPFNVTVDAVDQYWNIVSGANGTARLASIPAGLLTGTLTRAFTNGSAGFSIAVSTPFFNLNIQADDSSNAGITAQDNQINVYGAYFFNVIVPTFTVAGPPTTFPVTLELRDSNTGNLVGPNALPSPRPTATITILEGGVAGPGTVGTPAMPLSSDDINFTQTYTRAATVNMRVTAQIGPVAVSGTSGPILVNPGVYSNVQLIMPWETPHPGVPSAIGKTGGAPAYVLMNVNLAETVYAVDQYWNVVPSTTGTARLSTVPAGFAVGTTARSFTAGSADFTVALGTAGYNIALVADDQDDGSIGSQSELLLVFPEFPSYEVDVPTDAVMTPVNFSMSVRLKGSTSGNTINFATTTFQLSPTTTTPSVGFALGITSGTLIGGVASIPTQWTTRTGTMKIHASDAYGFTGDSILMNIHPENHYYQITVPTSAIFGVPFSLQVTRIDNATGLPVVRLRNLTFSAFDQNNVPITPPERIDVTSATMNLSPQAWSQTFHDPDEFVTSRNIYFLMQSNLDGDNLSYLSNLSTTSIVMFFHPGPAASLTMTISSPLLFQGGTATLNATVRDGIEGHRIQGENVNFSITQGTGTLTPPSAVTNSSGVAQTVLQTNLAQISQIYVIKGQDGVLTATVTVTLALPPVAMLTTSGQAITTSSDQVLRIKDSTSLGITAASVVGISAIWYQVDNGPYTIYTSTFTLPVGLHTLHFYAIDGASPTPDVGPVQVQQVQVSITANGTGSLLNYPNPFHAGRESTLLEYTLVSPAGLRLRIYNLLGQLVYQREISQGSAGTAAGLNDLEWDGHNGNGNVVANGGYIAVLDNHETGERLTRKIAVVK